jgi:hypothetical protein
MAEGQAAVQRVRNDERDEKESGYANHLDHASGTWHRLSAESQRTRMASGQWIQLRNDSSGAHDQYEALLTISQVSLLTPLPPFSFKYSNHRALDSGFQPGSFEG